MNGEKNVISPNRADAIHPEMHAVRRFLVGGLNLTYLTQIGGLDLDHVSEQEPENGPTWSAWGSHLVIVALATGIPQSPQGRGDLLPPVFDEQSFVIDL